jgi:hypothetical protein
LTDDYDNETPSKHTGHKRVRFDAGTAEEPPKKQVKITVKFAQNDVNATVAVPANNDENHEDDDENDDDHEDSHKKKKKKHHEDSIPTLVPILCVVIDELFKADTSQIFWYPVDVNQVPGYHDIIKHPMDLSTLKMNLTGFKYKSTKHFLHDMERIFKNCTEFNPPDTVFYTEAKRISKLAKGLTQGIDKRGRIIAHEGTPQGDEETIATRKKRMIGIIDELIEIDDQYIFQEAVPVVVPEYYSLIHQPLNLTTLRHITKKNRIPSTAALKVY